MPTNILLENNTLVDCLRSAINKGEDGLANVPALLTRILREDRWRERIIHQTGEIQTFTRFEDFVTMPPLEGLGATIEIIKAICRTDPGALDLLDQATTGKPHIHTGRANGDNDNVMVTPDQGNAATYALRRLRKNRPDLHARVLASEITPHGAMIEAGYRERMIQVPHDVDRAARVLRRQFTTDQVVRLVELLSIE